jgi:hypothetical protein
MIKVAQSITAFLLLTAIAISVGCSGPPQIGDDREVFKSVDALYTAISLRDPALVDQCRVKLDDLRGSGQLPAPASDSLNALITKAKGGDWESALEELDRFITGQRRG